jgi:hypothetical protein
VPFRHQLAKKRQLEE